MSNVLRIAVVDPKDATRETLKSMLLGLDSVWLEAECSRYEFFADVVGQTNPDVGFVALDSNPDKALELVESLAKSSPTCAVLVTSTSTDGNLILRVMRSGAKEFLTLPLKTEDLSAALTARLPPAIRRFGRWPPRLFDHRGDGLHRWRWDYERGREP